MIDLYTWSTPNGRKISIMLEETGLPYNVIPVNIGYDEQYEPSFTVINPNNKIPAIVDHDNNDFALAESGAILYYLAEKSGQFLPPEEYRWEALQWMMFQKISPVSASCVSKAALVLDSSTARTG